MRFSPYFLLLLLFLSACGSQSEQSKDCYAGNKPNELVYQTLAEPSSLAIHIPPTSSSDQVKALIHRWLYTFENDGNVYPVLAAAPLKLSEDGLTYEVSVHPDAKWEDGKPIDGKDVLFSLKYLLCPNLVDANFKPYFEVVKDVVVDAQNPKKFQLTCKSFQIMNDLLLTNVPIVDGRFYDPEKILEGYKLTDFTDFQKDWSKDEKLKAFAAKISEAKYGHDPAFVKGGGPYQLKSWEPGQQIVLTKRATDWSKSGNFYQMTYPEKIVITFQKEPKAMEAAIQQELVDFNYSVSTEVFQNLQKNPAVAKNYNFYTPPTGSSAFLIPNMKGDGIKHSPVFSDLAARSALAHLMPINTIIERFYKGIATPIATNVPSEHPFLNKKLAPRAFDIQKADAILKAAGWKDTDGNQILDKMIGGKKVQFSFKLTYAGPSEVRKNIALMIQDECKKGGIDCVLEEVSQQDVLQKAQERDFDLIFYAISNSFSQIDYSQLWRTDGALNFSGFGDAQTDKLVDAMQVEKDKNAYRKLSDDFQQLLYDQCPIIPFFSYKGRVVIHKRFQHGDKMLSPPYPMGYLEMQKCQ